PRTLQSYPLSLHDALPILAPLGLNYFDKAGFDPTLLDPVGAAGHLGQVTTLYARSSVFKGTAVAKTSQTAFVFVTDQFGRPVSRSEEHTSELQLDLVCRLL